jgi:hypothetical protein
LLFNFPATLAALHFLPAGLAGGAAFWWVAARHFGKTAELPEARWNANRMARKITWELAEFALAISLLAMVSCGLSLPTRHTKGLGICIPHFLEQEVNSPRGTWGAKIWGCGTILDAFYYLELGMNAELESEVVLSFPMDAGPAPVLSWIDESTLRITMPKDMSPRQDVPEHKGVKLELVTKVK